MSRLRLIYHRRKIAAASGAEHEADFYSESRPGIDFLTRFFQFSPPPNIQGFAFSDTFDRTSEDLGENWSQQYRGVGDSNVDGARALWLDTKQPPDFRIALPDPDAPLIVYTQFGRQELANHCSKCKKRWEQGDLAISENGGPFHHRDCTDPKGENEHRT